MLTSLMACVCLAVPFVEQPAEVLSEGVPLHGCWLWPNAASRVPLVLLAGGTMSQTRDGGLENGTPAGQQRDALGRLARQLAAAGYGSLRWDKRGHGATPAGTRPADNESEAADLQALLAAARAHPRVTAVVLAGESAGGYFACLAARAGSLADGYALLGCLASSSPELFAYNYGRLRDWAAEAPGNRAWCDEHCLEALAVGQHYEAMFAAAARGEETFTIEFAGRRWPRALARLRTELDHPPGELFRYLTRPTLVLQGERDMNVPPGDAARIEEVLRAAGQRDVTRVNVPLADHSFQYAADEADQRWRDRYDFGSFYRLYHPGLYSSLVTWLQARWPSPVAATAWDEPRPGIAAWEQVQVIEDVADARRSPGVETLEGRIGPHLKGAASQAHYIEMPAGLYLHEHPHATESLVFTVRGSWVLCHRGRRQLMRPGSLFWFAPDAPTGWEVPFDETAYVLIFKGTRSDWSDARFYEYLRGLADRCREEQAGGEAFRFDVLPADHPARLYARQVNPAWEQRLPR
ncbi:MAG: alpha/beta hydrolase [Fimbriimonadaceae bacterium]|nr:alpha/beta hydrolase [Fimbriimonadaceae bacterium]